MAQSHLDVLRECAEEIGAAVSLHQGRGMSGLRPTQYHLDVVADEIAVRMLTNSGYRVVSEESGVSGAGEHTVVVDPIDGSTNCDRGVPFFATSLAVLRQGELVAGFVKNQATGTEYQAELSNGATRDGISIHPSGLLELSEAIVSFSGRPEQHLGWSQSRSLGAASLEICLVADGSLDFFGVAQRSSLHSWDYLAGLLICKESGAVYSDYDGDELITEEAVARHPAFAATPRLLETVMLAGTI